MSDVENMEIISKGDLPPPEKMLRGMMPLLFLAGLNVVLCLAWFGAFLNIPPSNPWYDLVHDLEQHYDLFYIFYFVSLGIVAIIAIMFGFPPKREVVASTAAMIVGLIGSIGLAVLLGKDHPLLVFIILLIAVPSIMRRVFVRVNNWLGV